MRRLIAIASVVVLCLGLFPARADAYFWDWLDSLSGPRFKGWNVQWRVWCDSGNALQELQEAIAAELALYAAAENAASPIARPYLERARESVERAAEYADDAGKAIPSHDSNQFIALALTWRIKAREFAENGRTQEAKGGDVRPVVTLPRKESVASTSDPAKLNVLPGAVVSLCHANRYDRNKRFLAVNVGWGQDTKDADYTEKVTINGVRNNIDNKMLTVGAGFYSVALPWLTVGSGAGVAWFSSNRAASFQKLYIEPYIVEVKPLAFTGNSALTPWWRHVLFLSYSTLVFPTGFEAGRFQRSDPRFPAELVHVWGIHADLEPLMRRLAGNW